MKRNLFGLTQATILFGITVLAMSGVSFAEDKPKNELQELRLTNDEKKNEMRQLKTEMLVSKTETQAVAQLNRLLKKYKGTAMEPELWFRLAELKLRQSKTERFFELNRDSKDIVKFAPQKIKSASSKKYAREAINTFQMIETRFPRYSELDSVLFNHGYTLEALGETQKAAQKYEALIRRFNDSFLVPDAYLALGEIAFDARQYKTALERFNHVKAYPDSRVYPYGLYKAAWALYNLHQVPQGMKELEAVIAFGRKVKEQQLDARLDLRREALQDLVVFFEDGTPAKTAYDYFQNQAGELEYGPLLLSLAQLYHSHSRFREEEVVLTRFLDEQPKAKEAPDLHNRLIIAFESTKRKQLAVEQMQKMLVLCDSRSSWTRAQKNSESAYKECQEQLRTTSLQLASTWLRIWKKNQNMKDFAEAAEQTFPVYLTIALDNQEAMDTRFAYSELLFQREKFYQASEQYEKVCTVAKAKEMSHSSCYGALLALQKATKNKWSGRDEDRFLKLTDTYVQKHPKGQYRLDVEFEVGRLHYEKNRWPQAQAIFQRLGNEFAKTEKGMKSQDLYLDILNNNKNYTAIRDYTAQLIHQSPKAERQAKLQSLMEEAHFLQIQKMEEDKKVDQAVKEYRVFMAKYPSSKLNDKAAWNHTQLLIAQKDYQSAALSFNDYARKFPKSPKAEDALVKAAQIFESMGDLSRAAMTMEYLMDFSPKNRWKWAMTAADFYALENEFDKAKTKYMAIMSQGNAEQKKTAEDHYYILLQNRYEQTKNDAILRQLADVRVQPYRSWAQVQLLRKLAAHNTQAAFLEARDILKSSATPEAKAEARFVQARILQSEFVNQSLKSSVERLTAVIGLKTEKLEKVVQAYQEVIRYGDPQMTMKAFNEMSNAYDHYITSLKQMPMPKGLGAEDEEVFRSEISKLISPIEEKRVDVLAQAVQVGRKVKVYSEAQGQLKRALDQANGQSDGVPFQIQIDAPMTLPAWKGMGS